MLLIRPHNMLCLRVTGIGSVIMKELCADNNSVVLCAIIGSEQGGGCYFE